MVVRIRSSLFTYSGIPFNSFILYSSDRYKFLAFDFDENVEVTKDNCRLLLIRLKMEGWVIGRSKVFLKYYNEEYLSRLYETQVKKIVKVQCMMRAFLARKTMASKVTKLAKAQKPAPRTMEIGAYSFSRQPRFARPFECPAFFR